MPGPGQFSNKRQPGLPHHFGRRIHAGHRPSSNSVDSCARDGGITNLAAKAWVALVVLAVVMGLLLFVPAGTVRYWQAWAYLSIFIGASFLTTLDLMRRDP